MSDVYNAGIQPFNSDTDQTLLRKIALGISSAMGGGAGGGVQSVAAGSPTQGTFRIVSAAATTNGANVKNSAGIVQKITGTNSNAAVRYLKFYDKATAPTVGTDTPIWTESLPAQARFDITFPPLVFRNGISIAFTTGAPNADTGALTAGDIMAFNLAFA